MSKEEIFLQPYIEANNFWLSITGWVWLISLVMFIIFGLWTLRNLYRPGYSNWESVTAFSVVLCAASIVVTSIILICLYLGNYNMKKFPKIYYNEKVRFVEKKYKN
jgi:hypothetical protein